MKNKTTEKPAYWKLEISRKNGKFSRQQIRLLGRKLEKVVPDFVDWHNHTGVMFKFRNEAVKKAIVPRLTRIILEWEENGGFI